MSASLELTNMRAKVSKDSTHAKRKSEDLVGPVSPGSTGNGLPYAPVDWPNPGDDWDWRVGRRVKGSGIFHDRFLYGPHSLEEKPGKRLFFNSKTSVVRYLKSAFPEADIDAFFASFTWDIPGTAESSKRAKPDPSPLIPPGEETGRRKVGRPSKRTRKAASRENSPLPSKNRGNHLALEVYFGEQTLASGASNKALGSNHVCDSHAGVSPGVSDCHSPIDLKSEGLTSLDESQAGLIPEDFDNFVNSLDEILALPLPKVETFGSAPSQDGMTEARAKLSSFLAMDFASLAASNKLKQLAALSSKLQYDPTLSHEELSMLKLIQEIPLSSKNYLEAEKVFGQAEKFFTDLDANVSSVASLKNEYSDAKEQLELCQAEESSALLALLDIDEKIAALQARRADLAQTIKATNRKIVQYSSSQKKVMERLPKIVHEVQVANSEKEDWELKKKKSAEQLAEILARFAPLQGFSF